MLSGLASALTKHRVRWLRLDPEDGHCRTSGHELIGDVRAVYGSTSTHADCGFRLPLVEDGDFFLTTPSSSLFPGLPSGIEMHNGFLEQHALFVLHLVLSFSSLFMLLHRTAASILAAVQKTMSTYGTKTVTTVGHSLGAAVALLDAVYLLLHLPSGTAIRTYAYGLPRVGNPAFAAYVDSTSHLTHINNEKDIGMHRYS
jgi:pimeloyl-ACP methyl ester carboxylesterase